MEFIKACLKTIIVYIFMLYAVRFILFAEDEKNNVGEFLRDLTDFHNPEFSIDNIPFGVYLNEKYGPRPCTRFGNYVADLVQLEELGVFQGSKCKDLTIFKH